jgi:hypothetical protein
MSEVEGASEAAAADFARRFAEYWLAPTPERLDMALASRVRKSRLRQLRR